ncbi:ATP-dependent Clp protease proteolytic subunit [Psychromonas sp. SP041]|uniref:ATP-dependent Clp protease proteolytic subunit n=1 Tax=Psychromonas sp. SP041 TaxID=1365007 RepID=UPI0010C7C316|nr:ATP-dependent Clp protease proteolytic subunit [Psychromonas sp. SP041]
MNFVPTVIQSNGTQERVSDIYSAMLNKQVIFCTGEVNDMMANAVIAQLLFLESENSDKDIYMYINSPGGSVSAGMAIYDTMKFIKPDVHTVVTGQACSMGAFLLAGGAKGKRSSLPNAKVMIHQPLGGFQGQASDFEIHANEMARVKAKLNKILSENTGKDYETVVLDTNRDNFLTPEDAVAYGLIDSIVESR